MITHIYSATVLVRDQDEAVKFYTEKLGWEKRSDTPFGEGSRWIEVGPPGAVTVLALLRPEDVEAPPEAAGSEDGVTLVADDIQATYEELSGRGVEFTQPPAEMPWGQKATWFKDLDGNTHFLVGD
jgi:catechol 2,3-dioxygenase-like lactoylglutathione lyase family enzyme